MGPTEENQGLEVGIEFLDNKGVCHLSLQGTQPAPHPTAGPHEALI